jgi:DNA-directed RNA polymerase subunit alpha
LSATQPFTIETVESGLNYARYKVEPLEPGYGTTMGNALRRILLRSLPGTAIGRVRIEGVWHEFATVNHVREDVTEIVLNLKRIRLKTLMPFEGELSAHLYERGDPSGEERVVTAGHVKFPAQVEVINPDQVLATLSTTDAVLDMDVWISTGRGYRPAEAEGQSDKNKNLGEIPIDAIFTPIQRVNFVVEQTRVGGDTDYDRLILEILTDGTIEPDDALSMAAEVLVDHARVFAEFGQRGAVVDTTAGPIISEAIQNKPLTELGLSSRVLNALKSKGIDRVGQVLMMDPEELRTIRNFGPRSFLELREKLAEHGYLADGSVISAGTGADGFADDPATLDLQEAVASLLDDSGSMDEEE